MVAFTFATLEPDGKWLKYIGLSILANVLLISAINIVNLPEKITEMPMLKVNLMALAGPSALEPVKQHLQRPASPAATQKIVTHAQAQKKITTFKPQVVAKPLVTHPKPVTKKTPQKKAVTKPAAKVPNKTLGKKESTVIHKAKYRKQIPPIYPRRAFDLDQQGTVTLHAQVSATGLLRKLKIAKSSGHRMLDMAALAAVKKWEFEPTNVNGKTITSWVLVPVHFVIRK